MAASWARLMRMPLQSKHLIAGSGTDTKPGSVLEVHAEAGMMEGGKPNREAALGTDYTRQGTGRGAAASHLTPTPPQSRSS
jgi:hypothetical protein